jgi:hypothetical protein
MLDLFRDQPWLVLAGLGMLIPLFGIVFGTITSYLVKVRRAELEAGLKQTMLERGMSAEEIRTVIEASARRRCRKGASELSVR